MSNTTLRVLVPALLVSLSWQPAVSLGQDSPARVEPVAPAEVVPPPAAEPAPDPVPPPTAAARSLPPTAAEPERHKKKKHKGHNEPPDAHVAAEPDPAGDDLPNDPEQLGGQPEQGFEGDPWGDEPSDLVAGPLSMRVLLQTRYEDTTASASTRMAPPGWALRENVLVRDGDGFSLQRFFFRIAADPSPLIGFKAILDFAKLRGSDVSNVLKQAYGTLRPIPKRLEFAAGVFKLPFSILELDAVARYELSSLGDADGFIKDLGFAGRDVGVEVMFAPLPRPRWLRVLAGAFRGHAKDEHASPLGAIGARLESKPIKGLRVGVDVVGMPYSADYKRPFETSGKEELPSPPDPMNPSERRWAGGKAYSADVTYSRHRFTVRGEGMLGDRVDVDLRYGARSFWAAWALVAYRFPVGPVRLMPAARIEFLDADREHKGGLRRELTLGVNVLFSKTVRMLVDVTRTDVQATTLAIEQPLPVQIYPYYDLDNTRVVAQLQLEL